MHLRAAFATLILLGVVGVCVSAPARCTYVFYYQPVCGTDGKTYINMGQLICQALKRTDLDLAYDGECVGAETTTVVAPFAELDVESNETIALSKTNMTLENLEQSLAKLNISLEEMRAALAELNMTIDDLNVSTAYLNPNPNTNRPVGYYGYNRYGRPYGYGGYGYGSDEFGDFSLEFGFGHHKVSRLLMAAAVAGAITHHMNNRNKMKYGSMMGGGMVGGMGGGMAGGMGGNYRQPFPSSSIGRQNSYGWRNSVVNPGGVGGGQQFSPVKPVPGGYPKQQQPARPSPWGQPGKVVRPPPYSPYKPPPPYSPPKTYQKPPPKYEPSAPKQETHRGSQSGSGGDRNRNPPVQTSGSRSSSSGKSSSSGGRRTGGRGGGRKG